VPHLRADDHCEGAGKVIPTVTPYGEGATFVDLHAEGAPDRAARTHALAEALREAWPAADVIVGAGTVVVVGIAPDEVARVARSATTTRAPRAPRIHAIAAVYDGPDLEAVAEALGLTPEDVVTRHTEADHVVELVGFLPGFAYLATPGGSRCRAAPPRGPGSRRGASRWRPGSPGSIRSHRRAGGT
jgi:allophanate hydrolase subunit 1